MDHTITPATSPDELLDRVQALSDAVDELADPRARELAHELVGAVVAMYGDGLRRIVATIESAREAGVIILDELAQDGAVASLLLIHDLYPVSLYDRVVEALDTVRPYMESHGGNVELRGVEDGIARLSLQGSCHGCAASRSTLELAIKQALDEHAPDLVGLEVEGVDEPVVVDPPRSGRCRWLSVDEVGDAGGRRAAIAGNRRRRSSLSPTSTARCSPTATPARRAASHCTRGELSGPMLRCPHCEVEFDLPRAGRAGGRRAAPAGAGAAAARRRAAGGRVSDRLDAMVAARRRAETLARLRSLAQGAPAPPLTGAPAVHPPAGRAAAGALRPVRDDRAGRSPPSPASDRAAHRLRLRAVLGAPLRRPGVPADRDADASG